MATTVDGSTGVSQIQDDKVTVDKLDLISTGSVPSLEAKGTSGVTSGYLKLNCSENSHGIKLLGPPHSATADYTLTFPNNDGDADQFLQTNGSGVMTWAAADVSALNASNLTSGTVPDARFPATLPAISGANLTDLPAAAKLSTASGSAPSYSARAWANLDTDGTVSVRGSGNVSSLTDNGEGDFTVNFATAMQDDNYSVSLCSGRVESIVTGNGSNDTTRPDWTASACRIRSTTSGGSSRDQIEITIAIFR